MDSSTCNAILNLYFGPDFHSYKSIGNILNLPESTVGYIIRRYKKDGSSCSKSKGGNKQPIKMTGEVKRYMIEMEDKDCTLTLEELRDKLVEHFQNIRTLSITSIHDALQDFCYTLKDLRKLPYGRNSDETKNKRCSYVTLFRTIKTHYNFVFIDESNFNLWTTRGKGRSQAGDRACYTVPNSKGRQVSLILAISPALGTVHNNIIQGSCNAIKYLNYLQELIDKLRIQRRLNNFDLPYMLVMDNCSIHHTEDVENYLDSSDSGFKYMYLPPYSPFLNPIEESFSCLKADFKKRIKGCREKIVNMQTTNNLSFEAARRIYVEQNIIESLPVVTREKCGNFYIHIFDFFDLCLQRQDVL